MTNWATYTGSNLKGAAGTGEVLREGDFVRVEETVERIEETYALITKPLPVYGTGNAETAWLVPLQTLEF